MVARLQTGTTPTSLTSLSWLASKRAQCRCNYAEMELILMKFLDFSGISGIYSRILNLLSKIINFLSKFKILEFLEFKKCIKNIAFF